MGICLAVRAYGEGQSGAEVGYQFGHTRIVIGRASGADVQLPDAAVSQVHATIRVADSSFVVIDEGSTNGTSLNGARLTAQRAAVLHNGDVLQVGNFHIVFSATPTTPEVTSSERTASLARRLARELLGFKGQSLALPRLQICEGPQLGQRLEFDEAPTRLLIGRAAHCDLVLQDDKVSREHAAVERDGDGVVLSDLGGKNPTLVNGKPTRLRRLRHGDTVQLGNSQMQFVEPAEEVLGALQAVPDAAQPLSTALADLGARASNVAAGAVVAEIGGQASTLSSRRGLNAELTIYLLAMVVLAASLGGLFVLLGSR